MKSVYAAPFKVYLMLGLAALAGIFAGLQLPISLFPNSHKPTIRVSYNYGDMTPQDFLRGYGEDLERRLQALNSDRVQVESVKGEYDSGEARIFVDFKWGSKPTDALKEVETVANGFAASMPREIRDSQNIWNWGEGEGFLAVNFFSEQRSLDDIYELLEPRIWPEVSRLPDVGDGALFNPTRKEIRIDLDSTRMAGLQLLPKDVARAVENALRSQNGGAITVGAKQLSVQMPSSVKSLEELGAALVPTSRGAVHLRDIARIDFGPKSAGTRVIKISGTQSIMLYVSPKPGGNIKRMAEDSLAVVRRVMATAPADIQYRVVVDPSEFIRAAVNNVFHEVLIGAGLAVLVLYIFIGSLRNTLTAAIEIPLSMVLAFLLMKLSNMNVNLVSLGGLALSAGMNVDASVVVMENIFRHFEQVKGPLTYKERLEVLLKAVAEVRFAVIASTIASLVVFLPLAFTSDLSYAVLGDLAKTVIFSHGFSAFVALILVPTVRLQLMSSPKAMKEAHSPIEPWLKKLENFYSRSLGVFITRAKLRYGTYAGIVALFALLVTLVLPKLPREIIGLPDTDFLWMRINSTGGHTLMKQMESEIDGVEARVIDKFGSDIVYTFAQTWNPNGGSLMIRLKDKSQMERLWRAFEAEFVNTPVLRLGVNPWNPAELPIPHPPKLRVVVRTQDAEAGAELMQRIHGRLEENKVLPRLNTNPDVRPRESVVLTPHTEQWTNAEGRTLTFLPSDLVDYVRTVTSGRRVAEFPVKGEMTSVYLRYLDVKNPTREDIAALPVGVAGRVTPLKAFFDVDLKRLAPPVYRENGRQLFLLEGYPNRGDKVDDKELKSKVTDVLKEFAGKFAVEEGEQEIHDAIHQLGIAIGLSVVLIFLTMLLQFGDFMNALLVLVAVPLGFIGVVCALFVFRSTLSLNSMLGVILLNGIAVANSILLVDFINKLVASGLAPAHAAVEAGRLRLRPILITSLTTVLGMLPIALGLGEGGRILQPLGIAVAGGLWVSMALTLYVVPALQVAYLERKVRRS